MQEPQFYRSFLNAKIAGNVEEMIRNAWREIDDPNDYGQPGFRFLSQMAVLNCDVVGLEELRRRGRTKLELTKMNGRFVSEMDGLVESIDYDLECCRLLKAILESVVAQPGIARSILYDRFHVYRTKADMLKGEKHKPADLRASSYTPVARFEFLATSPLLRIEGEGTEARWFRSEAEPSSIICVNLREPRSQKKAAAIPSQNNRKVSAIAKESSGCLMLLTVGSSLLLLVLCIALQVTG